jgi:hypothetical protein
MKKKFIYCLLLVFSCSSNDVDMPEIVETDNNYEIKDESFGEYLYYSGAYGVIKEIENIGGSDVIKYYIDTVLSLNQTEPLNLSKSANSINTLETAGLTTAAVKIKNVDGLQYFISVTGLNFVSNEIENIDLTKLSDLKSLNLNNNFIGSLDLTKNTGLITLSYTASSRATETQKLTTIDLSNNINLTSIDLSNHTGAPFPVPASIFRNLTNAKGVISQ